MPLYAFLEDFMDVDFRECPDLDLFPVQPPCPYLTYGHLAPATVRRPTESLEMQVLRANTALTVVRAVVL